ncbi:DMT family transporter [Leptotrichia sp. OH3620_COT-345]|uniref:DMT family transporter n=1 Tax=Leptotrichia sp. OH3620_COT-345 TaxID=2491048 RepID=UPI000F645F88|nr:DMT family transporter [Leptotrichia sp. OH3620_COT-345]RRD39923.1 DMT family transporter [Leptotrichia sp. OH3620_COT-345]
MVEIPEPNREQHKNKIAQIFAFVAVFLWSISIIFTKLGMNYYDSTTLAVLRYVFTFIILLVFIVLKKVRLPDLKDIPAFLIAGLAGFALHMITFNKGVSMLSSGTSSILLACAPIFTSVLSVLFLKEKINFYCWISIFVSFSGIVILTLWEGIFSFNIGIFWMLLAAFLLAVYNIFQRKFSNKYSGTESTIYSILSGAILLMLYSPVSLLEIPKMRINEFIIVFSLAFLVSVVGYICWGKALVMGKSAGEIANFLFLGPFISTLTGIIFLNEKLMLSTVIGGTVILIGIVTFNKFKDK